MCYNAVSSTLTLIKYARHRGEYHLAEELVRKLEQLQIMRDPKFQVSGFDHPLLLCFTNAAPYQPDELVWGLVPAWAPDRKTANTLMNQTLNARAESIFEKPAFKNSAKNKRCLVYLDAFYEHHHANKQTYPYRIAMKDGSPMVVAGLWEEWTDRQSGEIMRTVSLVTTTANPLMTKIHNNPKAEGPRMPVILSRQVQDEWLQECKTDADWKQLKNLLSPLNEELLEAHTVARLKGKGALGNVPEAEKEVIYQELQFKDGELF